MLGAGINSTISTAENHLEEFGKVARKDCDLQRVSFYEENRAVQRRKFQGFLIFHNNCVTCVFLVSGDYPVKFGEIVGDGDIVIPRRIEDR